MGELDPSDPAAAPAGVPVWELRRGEPDAVGAWYSREHPEVYRLCLGFLARADEAEDAAQDAMLHLLDHLDAWDTSRPYRPWRNAVVANLCRDRLRRLEASRRAERTRTELTEHSVLPDPADAAHGKEARAMLEAALRDLSPREREVFVLRDLEELPTEEVALSLGIEPATVRSLGTLARRRLRKLLTPRLASATREGERDAF